MSQSLDDLLRPFGAQGDDIIDLSAELTGTARLDYRDLQRLTPGRRPDAIVRIAGRSVAYVMRGESGAAFSERVIRLRHLLAQRDDAAFLVVIRPGASWSMGSGSSASRSPRRRSRRSLPTTSTRARPFGV